MGIGRSRGGWTNAAQRYGGSTQVGGVDLYYEAAGPEFGPTLLFLHESGGSVATWEQQLLYLGGELRCLALDMPGHGRSAGRPIPCVQAYREWVLGFLEALAIRQRITLVGLGLGAAIALDLALVRPERVAGLVLTGGVQGGRASDRTLVLAAEGSLPSTAAEEFLAAIPSESVRTHWLRRWQKATPAARGADLSAMAQYDWSSGLERVSCPVLFLEGAQDPHVAVVRRAGARQVQIPGCGCLPPLERPAHYADAVRDFVATLQAPLRERPISRFG